MLAPYMADRVEERVLEETYVDMLPETLNLAVQVSTGTLTFGKFAPSIVSEYVSLRTGNSTLQCTSQLLSKRCH
jgi:hypothetical protein